MSSVKVQQNRNCHEAVIQLLFTDIITSEEANALHNKIDSKIKVPKGAKDNEQ